MDLPKALLLDLDDTIMVHSAGADPCWREVCAEFAGRAAAYRAGLSAGELFDAIEQSRRWFWRDRGRHRRGRLNIELARRRIVGEAFSRLGVTAPALSDEIADAYSARREATFDLFPGALEALRCFREQGIRLALVTNGTSRSQRHKIERFALAPYFDLILIEGEFGVGKPDERVYRHALEQLGLKAGEAWMVGDHLEWDVAAPQRLGLRGVWMDWAGSGLPTDSPVRPDGIVRSLLELARSIELEVETGGNV